MDEMACLSPVRRPHENFKDPRTRFTGAAVLVSLDQTALTGPRLLRSDASWNTGLADSVTFGNVRPCDHPCSSCAIWSRRPACSRPTSTRCPASATARGSTTSARCSPPSRPAWRRTASGSCATPAARGASRCSSGSCSWASRGAARRRASSRSRPSPCATRRTRTWASARWRFAHGRRSGAAPGSSRCCGSSPVRSCSSRRPRSGSAPTGRPTCTTEPQRGAKSTTDRSSTQTSWTT